VSTWDVGWSRVITTTVTLGGDQRGSDAARDETAGSAVATLVGGEAGRKRTEQRLPLAFSSQERLRGPKRYQWQWQCQCQCP
jgi:hypothetical protein